MKVRTKITTSIRFAEEEHQPLQPNRCKPLVDMFALLFEWSQQEKVKKEGEYEQ